MSRVTMIQHINIQISDRGRTREWYENVLGVPYAPPTIRAYSNGHSTYIKDPDGNQIELVQHPLGLNDSKGEKVELVHDTHSLTWTRLSGFGPSI